MLIFEELAADESPRVKDVFWMAKLVSVEIDNESVVSVKPESLMIERSNDQPVGD